MKTKIIPSILVKSKKEFLTQLTSVQDLVDIVQLDIADGKFVKNTTWANPDVVKKECKIDVELHLMVKNPLKELLRWSTVEQVKKILIHFESINNLEDIMPTLHAYGWEIGIVLNLETPITVLKPYLNEMNTVMFMGIKPGKQGQELDTKVLKKIKKFKKNNPKIFTSIDGGVNQNNLDKILSSGVDAICPGSAIFKNKNTIEENFKQLQKDIKKMK